ncbi:hypothetical protein JCM6882_000577 [Rhodosporidiobolus microsporus]
MPPPPPLPPSRSLDPQQHHQHWSSASHSAPAPPPSFANSPPSAHPNAFSFSEPYHSHPQYHLGGAAAMQDLSSYRPQFDPSLPLTSSAGPGSTTAGGSQRPHSSGLANGSTASAASMVPLSPTQSDPAHAWRDEGRRKSLRLDSGSLVGTAAGGGARAWEGVGGQQSSDAAARRASWAGQGAVQGYNTAATTMQPRPNTGGGQPGTYPASGGMAPYHQQQGATTFAAGYSLLPSQSYTPSMPSTSEDPRSSSSTGYGSGLPPPPGGFHPHPAYLASGATGYTPYTPASSSFPPGIYNGGGGAQQQYATPSTTGLFASPFSGSPGTAHPGYLPTPRTIYAPTPTIPPQATLASTSAYGNGYAPASPISPTFPLDASTPYIPSATPTSSPLVLTCAANRQRLGTIDLTGHSKPESAARRPSAASASTRRAIELSYDCQSCRRKLGTMTLRGGAVEKPTGDTPAKYVGAFYCSSCAALPPPSSGSGSASTGSGLPPNPANSYAGEASYYDTLTAYVDQHLGIDPKSQDTRPAPAAPGKTRSGFTPLASLGPGAKKRRSSVADSSEGILACDVCRRDLGSGTLQLTTGEAVGSTIEVICAHCETRYMRCSDCGGGGGQKGVGRWRSKEVFTKGRKTCMLSHTRLGTVNEMDYDIFPVSSLSRTDQIEVVEHCRDLYYTTLLGTIAVPDMIESVCPLARSYHEAEKICVDSWLTYEPLITTDVEATSNTRRYVALRWARPTTRKKKSGGKKGTGSPDLSGQGSPDNQPSPLPNVNGGAITNSPVQGQGAQPVIREGKTLTGFVLGELDLDAGILHVAITLPTGAGEAYDASTRLLQTLIARVHDDLAATNMHRAQMGLPAYPPCTMAWTMHMTKRDSRIMSRLETRRGFIPLEDYLVKHPETNRSYFPPHRQCYLPPEYLRGWTVYAKRLTRDDLPPPRSPSSRASDLNGNGGRPSSSAGPGGAGGAGMGYLSNLDGGGQPLGGGVRRASIR